MINANILNHPEEHSHNENSMSRRFSLAEKYMFPYLERAQTCEAAYETFKEISRFNCAGYEPLIHQAFYLKKYDEGVELIYEMIKSWEKHNTNYTRQYPSYKETMQIQLENIKQEFEPYIKAHENKDYYWLEWKIQTEANNMLLYIKSILKL